MPRRIKKTFFRNQQQQAVSARTRPPVPGGRGLGGRQPQHFLNFFPLPHGQGAFRPTFASAGLTANSALRVELRARRKSLLSCLSR